MQSHDDQPPGSNDATLIAPRTQQGVARLIVRRPDGQLQEYGLEKDEIVIGRLTTSDVVLQDDRSVSRRHAIIRRSNVGYVIEDLQSNNGTYVDGEKIQYPFVLHNGQSIKVGDNELTFKMMSAPLKESAQADPGAGFAMQPQGAPQSQGSGPAAAMAPTFNGPAVPAFNEPLQPAFNAAPPQPALPAQPAFGQPITPEAPAFGAPPLAAAFSANTGAPAPGQASAPAGTVICQNCGNATMGNKAFCLNCGASLGAQNLSPAPAGAAPFGAPDPFAQPQPGQGGFAPNQGFPAPGPQVGQQPAPQPWPPQPLGQAQPWPPQPQGQPQPAPQPWPPQPLGQPQPAPQPWPPQPGQPQPALQPWPPQPLGQPQPAPQPWPPQPQGQPQPAPQPWPPQPGQPQPAPQPWPPQPGQPQPGPFAPPGAAPTPAAGPIEGTVFFARGMRPLQTSDIRVRLATQSAAPGPLQPGMTVTVRIWPAAQEAFFLSGPGVTLRVPGPGGVEEGSIQVTPLRPTNPGATDQLLCMLVDANTGQPLQPNPVPAEIVISYQPVPQFDGPGSVRLT